MKPKAIVAVVALVASVLLAAPSATAQEGTIGRYDHRAGFKQIALSEGSFLYGCAILGDGRLRCWGENPGGDYETLEVSDPPQGAYVSVAVTEYASCAVETGGQLRCWFNWVEYGNKTYGPDYLYGSEVVNKAPSGKFTSVASNGDWELCGIRADGQVRCWGGHLDETEPPSGSYKQVDVGFGYACGIRTDDRLHCWGREDYDSRSWWGGIRPQGILLHPPSGTFTDVAAGVAHACALRPNGQVRCWGDTTKGTHDPPDERFTSLDAGLTHTCGRIDAERAYGRVSCWGPPVLGRTLMKHGRYATDVATSNDMTCIIRYKGTSKHGPNSRIVCKEHTIREYWQYER